MNNSNNLKITSVKPGTILNLNNPIKNKIVLKEIPSSLLNKPVTQITAISPLTNNRNVQAINLYPQTTNVALNTNPQNNHIDIMNGNNLNRNNLQSLPLVITNGLPTQLNNVSSLNKHQFIVHQSNTLNGKPIISQPSYVILNPSNYTQSQPKNGQTIKYIIQQPKPVISLRPIASNTLTQQPAQQIFSLSTEIQANQSQAHTPTQVSKPLTINNSTPIQKMTDQNIKIVGVLNQNQNQHNSSIGNSSLKIVSQPLKLPITTVNPNQIKCVDLMANPIKTDLTVLNSSLKNNPPTNRSELPVINNPSILSADISDTQLINQDNQQHKFLEIDNLSNVERHLNDLIMPDSRIFVSLLNENENNADLNKLTGLTLRTVTIENNEHFFLDNIENLSDFKGKFDELKDIACLLADRLNKPVSLPAFLSLDNQSVPGVKQILSQRNIDPIVVSASALDQKINSYKNKPISHQLVQKITKVKSENSKPMIKIENQKPQYHYLIQSLNTQENSVQTANLSYVPPSPILPVEPIINFSTQQVPQQTNELNTYQINSLPNQIGSSKRRVKTVKSLETLEPSSSIPQQTSYKNLSLPTEPSKEPDYIVIDDDVPTAKKPKRDLIDNYNSNSSDSSSSADSPNTPIIEIGSNINHQNQQFESNINSIINQEDIFDFLDTFETLTDTNIKNTNQNEKDNNYPTDETLFFQSNSNNDIKLIEKNKNQQDILNTNSNNNDSLFIIENHQGIFNLQNDPLSYTAMHEDFEFDFEAFST